MIAFKISCKEGSDFVVAVDLFKADDEERVGIGEGLDGLSGMIMNKKRLKSI